MMAPFAPTLPHRATVQRNTETGLDANRQPKPATFEVHDAALPCTYWEAVERPRAGVGTAGLRRGPDIGVLVEGTHLLVARTADIRIGDLVTEVRTPDGTVISSDRYEVVQDLWRRSHRELGLEVAKATAGVA